MFDELKAYVDSTFCASNIDKRVISSQLFLLSVASFLPEHDKTRSQLNRILDTLDSLFT